MLKKLYLWLRGYVLLSIKGKKAGRFLNLCTRHGIKVWNIHFSEPDSYCCSIFVRDFFKIRPLVHKTRVHIHIRYKKGLPFYLHRYRSRGCFALMLFGILFLILYSTGFVWKIELIGNSYVTEDVMVNYLADTGNGFGTAKKNIDCDALELAIRNDFPEVIWASVYLDGTQLVILIQENLLGAAQTGGTASGSGFADSSGNLTAAKDAQIASIITRSGTPMVKEGDMVLAGDILVSGICDIIDDNGEVADRIYTTADADITGYVTYAYNDVIPAEYTCYEPEAESKIRYSIALFDKTLSFPWDSIHEEGDYYVIEEYRQLCLSDNIYLPVFLEKKCYTRQNARTVLLTQQEAKEMANEHFSKFLKELEENGVSIIDKNVMMKSGENEYTVSGTVYCRESIAILTPLEEGTHNQ